jgi:hypothetical protein
VQEAVEKAILIARDIFGIDPECLWLRVITRQ